MTKHLNHIEILKYRQSVLPPLELLKVDRHLENCEECRLKLRENQELAMLYQSFFEPLQGANEEETSKLLKARLRERWRKLKSLHFFPPGKLLTDWRAQTAFTALIVLILGAVWFFNSGKIDNSIETAGNFVSTNPSILVLSDDQSADANEISPEQNADAPEISLKKRKNPQTRSDGLVLKKKLRGKNEPPVELVVNVNPIETDQSGNLAADENNKAPRTTADAAVKIEVKPVNNRLDVFFQMAEKADEYEVFIAEMPEFKTISREKTNESKWSIPIRKLKKGKDYILQITAVKKGMPERTIKRKISLQTGSKSN